MATHSFPVPTSLFQSVRDFQHKKTLNGASNSTEHIHIVTREGRFSHCMTSGNLPNFAPQSTTDSGSLFEPWNQLLGQHTGTRREMMKGHINS